MFGRILSSVPSATAYVEALVPNYAKTQAVVFIATLAFETLVRSAKTKSPSTVNTMKYVQVLTALSAHPHSTLTIKLLLSAVMIPFLWPITMEKQKKESFVIEKPIQVFDRPSFKMQVASVGNIVNIASKIINCLAAGVVIRNMLIGKTGGKTQVVATATLLLLSAGNIYYSIKEEIRKPLPPI